jgi:hypothetical protein
MGAPQGDNAEPERRKKEKREEVRRTQTGFAEELSGERSDPRASDGPC